MKYKLLLLLPILKQHESEMQQQSRIDGDRMNVAGKQASKQTGSSSYTSIDSPSLSFFLSSQ